MQSIMWDLQEVDETTSIHVPRQAPAAVPLAFCIWLQRHLDALVEQPATSTAHPTKQGDDECQQK